jgi:transposase-like protein
VKVSPGLPEAALETHLPASAVARLLGIRTRTLSKWRRTHRGPTGFFHVSKTLVIYPASSVEAFVRKLKRRRP